MAAAVLHADWSGASVSRCRHTRYRPEYAADYVPTVGFDKDFKRVRFAYINVNTTADCSDPHENREELYDGTPTPNGAGWMAHASPRARQHTRDATVLCCPPPSVAAWQGFVDERLAVAPTGTKSMYLTSYW